MGSWTSISLVTRGWPEHGFYTIRFIHFSRRRVFNIPIYVFVDRARTSPAMTSVENCISVKIFASFFFLSQRRILYGQIVSLTPASGSKITVRKSFARENGPLGKLPRVMIDTTRRGRVKLVNNNSAIYHCVRSSRRL